MKFITLSILTVFISTVTAIVPPGASTPLFYLVASSKNGGSGNLLVSTHLNSSPHSLTSTIKKPLRTNGGAGGYATLTGSGPIGQFYFSQGTLYTLPQQPNSISPQRALIGSILGSTGCSNYGSLGFTEGSSSNKCARYNTFNIQSNQENSQLGARLSFNFVGQFYACGSGEDVSFFFFFF